MPASLPPVGVHRFGKYEKRCSDNPHTICQLDKKETVFTFETSKKRFLRNCGVPVPADNEIYFNSYRPLL
jgi:hypothetical protein